MAIPLLFLLRHSVELSLKAIFISHNVSFNQEHNLKKLLKAGESCIDFNKRDVNKHWEEIKKIVDDFVDINIDGESIFKDEDVSSLVWRYLQVDEIDKYSRLKDINYRCLIERAKRIRALCELLTIGTSIETYWE